MARRPISLHVDRVPLPELLIELATIAGLELVVDDDSVADRVVTLQVKEIHLGELLGHLESILPIRFWARRSLLRVAGRTGPRLSLLIYPLPGGLVPTERPTDFDSLRQLSFISRSQRSGSTATEPHLAPESPADSFSHLETFLERLPEFLPWPPGSAWHLDRRQNLLLIRSTPETLALVESCLDRLVREPVLVEIEASFVEVSEGFVEELGVEFGLREDFPLRRDGFGRTELALGDESATRWGGAGELLGARLSVLGVLTQPRFEAVVRALSRDEQAEVISAPAVTTVNNSRATLAVTTNLPFIEDYRPVFDTNLVARDGISTADANVALVAVINDENFTGIVLNVTPSVGAAEGRIQIRLQPVVRDQVGAITISDGALVEGVATPAIARPIIETRFIDTQLAIPAGSTVVLGGLKTSATRTVVTGIPLLRSLPVLGALFRNEVQRRERRDLLIFVTARVVEDPAPDAFSRAPQRSGADG